VASCFECRFSVKLNGLARAMTTHWILQRTVDVQIVSSPNQADKSYITAQYDRYVGGNTALAYPDGAGMIRVSEETGLGVALSTDANGRYCQLDPYQGATSCSCRELIETLQPAEQATGSDQLLKLWSPENPEVMWQFKQATPVLPMAVLN
jgi:phosphoribosylformylglycinamidine synthase subunit PurL